MIELRPVAESDAAALFPLIYKSPVTDTLVWDGPESLQAYREGLRSRAEWMSKGGDLNFTLYDTESRAVGAVGMMFDRDNKSATIGLWIGLPFHGLGYGSNAIGQLVRLAFGKLGLERLEARIYTGNSASRRIFEKAGFKLEGTMRRVAFKRGVFIDEWVMGAIREEYSG